MTDEKLCILHIDDEFGTLKMFNLMLQRFGYETVMAQEPRKGLALAFELRPHIILLDNMMPGLDGYELCRQLRADERTRSAVIIFMSASLYDERLKMAFESGADDGYALPQHPTSIRDAVSKWVPIALDRRHAEMPTIGGNPAPSQ
jgi:CheY-like chemotaxis protein